MTKTTQYKNTPIGPIPTEWEVKKLGEIGKFFKGKGVPKTEIIDSGYKCLTYGDLYSKYDFIIKDIKSFISDETAKISQKIEYGDICFAGSGETTKDIGKCAVFIDDDFGYAGGDIIVYRSKGNNPITLSYILNSEQIQNIKSKLGQGNSIVHIYSSQLENIHIPLPPLPEQQKIAEVLSTWDKAIQETDTIIKKLQDRNKAFSTSLLTGESRIEAFKKCHSSVLEIKDVAKEISLKNKEDHNYTVFSCTKYNGLVPSLEYFGKKIYSDNLKTYKIIKRNQFAYATNHIEEGSMGILEKEDIGLISPMYTIFEFNENVNLDYIFKMLKSDFYINEYKRRMEGSIDRRGGLRWSAFAQIKINLPTLEEQNAIAEILNTANQEVKQYQQKLEALKLQKKGLMQQLLTGKVRTV